MRRRVLEDRPDRVQTGRHPGVEIAGEQFVPGDLFRHESVQRTYALNDEAALIICDYGRGKRPETPFPYFSELFTGLEYVAATSMLQHGMVAQGVECIEAVRRRYDGERRNPQFAQRAECRVEENETDTDQRADPDHRPFEMSADNALGEGGDERGLRRRQRIR